MIPLNYDALAGISAQNHLEVTEIDVKRLRDDRSEIQLGDEIAFVATASFRLTGEGLALFQGLDPGYRDLAAGDELLVIGADAELRSDKLSIDEDGVALWLYDNYDFHFVLNGTEFDGFQSVGAVQIVPTGGFGTRPPGLAAMSSLPWLRKLNTAAVKGDYIDVDVRISPKLNKSAQSPAARNQALIAELPFAGSGLGLEISLHADPAADLTGRRFRIRLGSDGPGGDAVLELAVTAIPLSPSAAMTTTISPPSVPARPAHHKP